MVVASAGLADESAGPSLEESADRLMLLTPVPRMLKVPVSLLSLMDKALKKLLRR